VSRHGAQGNTFGTHQLLRCCGKSFNDIEIEKLEKYGKSWKGCLFSDDDVNKWNRKNSVNIA